MACGFEAETDIGAGDDDGLAREVVGRVDWLDKELIVEETHFVGRSVCITTVLCVVCVEDGEVKWGRADGW